jgi:hypothetical protein
MISGVQTPPSRLMQADIGQPGGGETFFLSFRVMTLTWVPSRNLVSLTIPESAGHLKLQGF